MSETIDVTKLVKDVMNDTMERAFYLQSKAFLEKNNEHLSEIARLKAEVERLRASSFVTAVPVEQYEKLKAEVERLNEELNYRKAIAIRVGIEAAKEGKQS
jgi:uncharacterized small protein (DUF1192 family)